MVTSIFITAAEFVSSLFPLDLNTWRWYPQHRLYSYFSDTVLSQFFLALIASLFFSVCRFKVISAVRIKTLKSQWFNTQEIIQGAQVVTLRSSVRGLPAHLEHLHSASRCMKMEYRGSHGRLYSLSLEVVYIISAHITLTRPQSHDCAEMLAGWELSLVG